MLSPLSPWLCWVPTGTKLAALGTGFLVAPCEGTLDVGFLLENNGWDPFDSQRRCNSLNIARQGACVISCSTNQSKQGCFEM